MARKRMLDPDFWLDEELARVSPHARLLYQGLWGICDDNNATLPNRPEWIKAQVFPYESVNTPQLLGELSKTGKITLFKHEEKEYWYIKNFFKHQRVEKPSKEKYPAFSEADSVSSSVIVGEESGNTPAEEKISKEKISKEKREEKLSSSIEYLRQIPEEDLKEFSNSYLVTFKEIIKKAQDLVNYCEMHGKKYKNYKALLRNAISKDFGIREQKKGMSISEQIEKAQQEGRIPQQ